MCKLLNSRGIMKNCVTKLTFALASLVTSLSGFMFANVFDNGTYAIQGGIGYRQDSIMWKMDDLERINPSSKSSLHFKDLEIFLIGAKFKGLLGCSFYTRASFDYGWIFDGSLREELIVNHRHESGHFNHNGLLTEGRFNKAVVHNKERGNSYVWDLDLGFGIPLQCWCDGFQIAPMVGFSYNRQQIQIRNKERIFVKHDPHFSQILCGDEIHQCTDHSNTYKAAWWGPWIGFDLSYLVDCWSFFGEFELHFGRAERTRNSSTGQEHFDRYSRTKSFWGTTTRIGANYEFCDNWYLEATVSYAHWISNEHRDSLYFSSGTARLDAGYMF